MRNDFGLIIISHGRPECETVKTLRESGYTGKIYIVVDDEDKTLDRYLEIYGCENIHIFHKYEWFDVGDNMDSPRTVGVFARNECLKVAREKGLKYYLEMDDDCKGLSFRYNDDGHLRGKKIKHFDSVINAICEYFDESDISGLGFGSAFDYIGGVQAFETSPVSRLLMNSFFLRADDNIMWLGRNSDDFITVISQQQQGKAWIKFTNIQAVYDVWSPKKKDKKQQGGSIEIYNSIGAYCLRFYGVIFHPDCYCVKMKISNTNCDGSAKANYTYPKIISQRWQKS